MGAQVGFRDAKIESTAYGSGTAGDTDYGTIVGLYSEDSRTDTTRLIFDKDHTENAPNGTTITCGTASVVVNNASTIGAEYYPTYFMTSRTGGAIVFDVGETYTCTVQ